MNNDMRDEFEEYVRKLTTAICKDIFYEQLKELFAKYEHEYSLYSEIVSKSEKASDRLEGEISDALIFLKGTEEKTGTAINQLNDDISDIRSSTEKMFADLHNYDDQKADEFIEKLSSYIENYKEETSRIFKEGNEQISDKLAGVITPQLLQQFLDSLEKNTSETKKLATFVGESYRKEVENSIKGIVESNRKAMEETDANVSKYVKSMMDTLDKTQKGATESIDAKAKEYTETTTKYASAIAQYFNNFLKKEKEERDKAIEEQKKIIQKIGPSDEKMAQLEQKVVRLEKAVSALQSQMDENNKKTQTVLGRFLTEYKNEETKMQESMNLMRIENAELSRRANSSAGITAILACVIFVLEVFNIFGVVGLLIAVGIVATVAFVNPKIRERILWIIRNRKL